MIKRFKVTELELDMAYYPRQRVDSYHVKELADALEAGAHMPPIVVDAKTKKVVDGFHRVNAYRKVWGDVAEIDAEVKKYDAEVEMFADAIRYNATHGRGLSPYDKANVLAKATHYNMELETISALLQMTLESAKEMKQERFAIYEMKPVVLKRSAAHFAGQELDSEQMNYVRKSGGLNQSFYINQVVAMLEYDAVDWQSEKIMKALRKLYELLGGVLKVNV